MTTTRFFECLLCADGSAQRRIERETLSAALLHLREHLGEDYTADLDKAIKATPGKEIDYLHIDFSGGYSTGQTHDFMLPDGRAWVRLYQSTVVGEPTKPKKGRR
ncbi:MAG: hypothetical protein HXX20_02150 [Chloroflexi bacterium]|nr:hypothetical protein [Chloroflexota bacterium]